MLKPAATSWQAERDLGAVATRISKEYPNSNQFLGARVMPLREAVVGSVQSMLELLAAAVAAVLLIASVNVANLVLGRAQGGRASLPCARRSAAVPDVCDDRC